MDKELFVQNVKHLCKLSGVSVTTACAESGAGKDLMNTMNRQKSIPSVERVHLLAAYLGVTTSELLGEVPLKIKKTDSGDGDGKEGSLTPDEQDLISAYRSADERARQMVDLALEPFIPPAQKPEETSPTAMRSPLPKGEGNKPSPLGKVAEAKPLTDEVDPLRAKADEYYRELVLEEKAAARSSASSGQGGR